MMPRKILTALRSAALLVLLITATAVASSQSNNQKDPEFCKTCHAIKPYYNSLHSGDLLAKSHGDAGLTCVDCHDDYIKKGVTKKDSSKALKKISFDDKFCLKCHDVKEVDNKLVFKFGREEVRPHSQHVGEFNCSKCHSMHRKSELLCAKCHVQPWMKTLPKRWNKPVKTEL